MAAIRSGSPCGVGTPIAFASNPDIDDSLRSGLEQPPLDTAKMTASRMLGKGLQMHGFLQGIRVKVHHLRVDSILRPTGISAKTGRRPS